VATQNGTIDSTYQPIAAIAFDPKPPYDVYAAANGGVAESTNDGELWTRLSGFSPTPAAAPRRGCTGEGC
jgi:hypothetical protein